MLDLLMRKHKRLLLSCLWQMAAMQEISQVGGEKVRESSAGVSQVAL